MSLKRMSMASTGIHALLLADLVLCTDEKRYCVVVVFVVHGFLYQYFNKIYLDALKIILIFILFLIFICLLCWWPELILLCI